MLLASNVTRKTYLQTKGNVATSKNASNGKTIPRKAVSKSVTKAKGKVPGNKTEKKASKAKAGYELYSDRDDPENGHRYPGYREQDFIRTLIEDYQTTESREASLLHNSLTESASGADISYTVEKHLRWNMDQKAPFNKRLYSSTPVPDTLYDSESRPGLPQSEQNEMGVGMVTEPDQFDCKKEGGSFMLSEAQREQVRQQLDAELLEEARAQNNELQEQAANLLNAQTLPQKTVSGNISASSGDQPVLSRTSASVAPPRSRPQIPLSGMAPKLMQSTQPDVNQKSQQPWNQAKIRMREIRRNCVQQSQVAELHPRPLQSYGSPQTRFGQASSIFPNSDGNKLTGVDGLTSQGGQDMNQNAEEHDSVPRVQQPVPSAMPWTQHSDGAKRNPVLFNRNNSNLYGIGQLNISQNASTDSTGLQSRRAQDSGRSTPVQREAAAADTGRRSGWTDFPTSSEAQDIDNKKVNDSCLDTSQFQTAFTQLAMYSEKKGDSTLRKLVHGLSESFTGLQQMTRCVLVEKGELLRKINQLNKLLRKDDKNRRRRLSASETTLEFNDSNENVLLKSKVVDLENQLKEVEAQLSTERHRYRKQCEALMQQSQRLRLELKEKENEARVCHQEKEMNTSNLQSEMYSKSLHIKSLEGKVAKADQEKSSLENFNQMKDSQIKNLQESLGSVKQAATEMMDHLEHGTDVKHLLTLHCSRILQKFVQSSSFSRPDQTSARDICLDMSGNQRTSTTITPGRSGNENLNPATVSSDRKAVEVSQQPRSAKETVSIPMTKSELFPKDITNIKEPALVKESRSTKSEPSPKLTVAAVAAHNQKLCTAQEEPKSSVHSWDETELRNQPKPCSSDAVHRDGGSFVQKYNSIQQWSSGIQIERQKVANHGEDLFHDRNTARGSELPHDNKADAVSEMESVMTLSERSVSQGKTGSVLETCSWHSISEVTISEMDCSGPVKDEHFPAEFSKASLSASKHGRKYLSAKPPTVTSATVYTSSPPVSPRKRGLELVWHTDPREDKKRSPLGTSVSSTLTRNTSTVTQRDFFKASVLDLSASTIQEAAQSTMTSANESALEKDQLTEKLNKLTGDIDKATEGLQQLKNK